MPTTREDQQFAEFYAFNAIGQTVAGRVTRFGKNDNGMFAILSPVLVRGADANKPDGVRFWRFHEIAIGLSANLRAKLVEEDLGKFFRLTFTDRVPSRGQTPKKVFHVEELTRDEMTALAKDAEDKGRYTPPPRDPREPSQEFAPVEDDDLPF